MKYIMLWEMDMSKFPTDPAENAKLNAKLIEMTKYWVKTHPDGEWGKFLGENKGYSIVGSQEDIMQASMMFSPYVEFKVYQAVTIEEIEVAFKAMMVMMQGK
jgi:hypothetical protein